MQVRSSATIRRRGWGEKAMLRRKVGSIAVSSILSTVMFAAGLHATAQDAKAKYPSMECAYSVERKVGCGKGSAAKLSGLHSRPLANPVGLVGVCGLAWSRRRYEPVLAEEALNGPVCATR